MDRILRILCPHDLADCSDDLTIMSGNSDSVCWIINQRMIEVHLFLLVFEMLIPHFSFFSLHHEFLSVLPLFSKILERLFHVPPKSFSHLVLKILEPSFDRGSSLDVFVENHELFLIRIHSFNSLTVNDLNPDEVIEASLEMPLNN